MSGAWVREAEAALSSGSSDERIRVLRGERPMVLDAEGVKALLAPFLAALVWGAAVFREMVAGSSLDPMAMFLRLLALGLTVRVFLLGAMLLKRVRVWLRSTRYGLVLTDGGLFYRAPDMDVVVPKADIVGILERGRWQTRRAPGRRWSEVFIATDPASGRTHVSLPPVFDATPGQLAERLMRWRGAPAAASPPTAPPAEIASQVWDDAVKGKVAPGTVAVRHGYEWLTMAPYAAILVGITAAEGLARAGAEAWQALDPMVGGGLAIAFLLIPARWAWMNRREVAPRQGIAFILTPAEVLIRTHQGMLRTRYKDLVTVAADGKRAWSVLQGAHHARQIVLTRQLAPVIRYDEPYLGVPVEVAQLLVDAYRGGALPRGLAREPGPENAGTEGEEE